MKQMKVPQLAVVLGMGLFMVACGGEGEERGRSFRRRPLLLSGPTNICRPVGGPMRPKWKKGGRSIIGETNPDVNCASCHGKDGKPAKAGARDFRVVERMKLYSDSVWVWRIAEGVPNTKMKAWKSKLSEEDIWKVMLFERSFGLAGKGWDADKKSWVDAASVSAAPAAAPAAPAPAGK